MNIPYAKMQKLGIEFYRREDVTQVAADLLGKLLVTVLDGKKTIGRIVETEAYAGETDRASHAFGGRRTGRTEVMYGKPGTAYIYLCYGLHQMFNVVTNEPGIPHAVLVRAIEPVSGLLHMQQRTGKTRDDQSMGRGPGNLGKAMGLHTGLSGTSLTGSLIYLADDGWKPGAGEIGISSRIGVDYAGADAALPYRFFIRHHPCVSGSLVPKAKKRIA